MPDTGSCSSAIPESFHAELMTDLNVVKTMVKNAKYKTVRMASEKSIPVHREIVLNFFHESEIEETFTILPTKNSDVLGSLFSAKKNYSTERNQKTGTGEKSTPKQK